MLHRFDENTEGIARPDRFTWPFCYEPHPLARMAAAQLQRLLRERAASDVAWRREVADGKMFGVLVVGDAAGGLGFLAAFSGNIAGTNLHEGFVPPVYDMLQPAEHFRREEAAISAINHRIGVLEEDGECRRLEAALAAAQRTAAEEIAAAKASAARAKSRRDERRAAGEPEQALIAESRHERAELHRLKLHHRALVDAAQAALRECESVVETLRAERSRRSMELQMWLFRQFRLLNARGEVRNLCDLFAPTPQRTPPAGAGECAAPKLLQYAYLNRLTPIAMAEFWQGRSPRGEIRRHGEFYPSCMGKCHPILTFMLQGLEVDDDPMRGVRSADPQVVWEDERILAVNKPSGMLSVEGLSGARSVERWAGERYGEGAFAKPAHRLDQATSGVLLVARDLDTYRSLQEQFARRRVKKRYVALLEGEVAQMSGEISLPIAPDYENRPRQRVAADGAEAVTRFEVVSVERDGRGKTLTRIYLYPLTGRTHQLRLHAAHSEGLDAPIAGDALYGCGCTGGRLCLHAESIEFTHPATGRRISLTTEIPF